MHENQNRGGWPSAWVRVTGAAGLCAALLLTRPAFGCSPPETTPAWSSVARALYGSSLRGQPLRLNGDVVAVENQSGRDWTNVEIQVNTYFRATFSSIAAGACAQTPLNTFFDGKGHTFNPGRARPADLRLTAKLPDGQTLELKQTLR
jgi:hypothetical protein